MYIITQNPVVETDNVICGKKHVMC